MSKCAVYVKVVSWGCCDGCSIVMAVLRDDFCNGEIIKVVVINSQIFSTME